MSRHPKAKMASVVREETGDAAGSGHVIVRGKHPKARGKKGDLLYIAKENRAGEITDAGVYEVGIDGFEEDVFYGVDGKAVHDE